MTRGTSIKLAGSRISIKTNCAGDCCSAELGPESLATDIEYDSRLEYGDRMRPICKARGFPIKSTTHQTFRPARHHQIHRASPPPPLLWVSRNRPRNGNRSPFAEAASRLRNHRPARQGDTWANGASHRHYRRKADKAVLHLVGSVWRRMV